MLASLTPGPAVLLTIAVSLRSGIGAALRSILGICAGSTLFVLVAMAGLMAVFLTHRSVFRAIQLAGAAYLVYLGAKLLWSGIRAAAAIEVRSATHEHPFVEGLVTQLGNPKSLLYWTALMPPFLDPGRSIPAQLLLLGVIGTVVDLAVLLSYAAGAASVRRWMQDPRYQRWMNLATGTLFAVTGLLLAIATPLGE